MRKINFFLILFVFTFSGCGFKSASQVSKEKFTIAEVVVSGEKKTGNKIKNEIMLSSGKNSVNLLFLKMNVEKIKQIKERDEKNKITKYQTTLAIDISIQNNKDRNKKNYSISNSLDYINTEKKIILIWSPKVACTTLHKWFIEDIYNLKLINSYNEYS